MAQRLDVGAQDLDDLDLRQCLRRRGTHPLVRQDRHLAEHLPGPEDGEQHGVAALTAAPDADPSADEHIHRVARLTFVVEVGVRRDLQVPAPRLERGAFAFGKRGEEGDVLDDDGQDTRTRIFACYNTHMNVV